MSKRFLLSFPALLYGVLRPPPPLIFHPAAIDRGDPGVLLLVLHPDLCGGLHRAHLDTEETSEVVDGAKGTRFLCFFFSPPPRVFWVQLGAFF